MPVSVIFQGPHGSDPEKAIEDLAQDAIPSQEAMLYAASRQITRIRERTMAGKDVNGQEFAPYSPKYAKTRVKKGRNDSPVDLLMSGRMLNSLRTENRGENEFAITIQDADAAVYAQALNDGNDRLPERRFFDTSDEELTEMQKDLFGFDKAK